MFLFPFTTCEVPNNHSFIKQPVSALVNFIATIILFYMATKAKTIHVSFALFCYGKYKIKIEHFLWKFINIFIINNFSRHSI